MPSLYEMYQQQSEQARLSNEQRKAVIENIFDKIISMYGPEGSFGKGYEAQLAGQKVQDVGAAAQRGISSGLYGLRNYGQEWEATVGAPARLKLEDIKTERLSSALMAKAGFLENIQEPYPDYTPLLQASSAQASTPTFTRTYGRTYGASSFPDMFSIPGESGGTATSGVSGTTGKTGAGYSPYLKPSSTPIPTDYTANVAAPTAAAQPTSQAANAPMSATEAMKKYATYEEFASWAKGQGLNPGSKKEWQVVKNRIG